QLVRARAGDLRGRPDRVPRPPDLDRGPWPSRAAPGLLGAALGTRGRTPAAALARGAARVPVGARRRQLAFGAMRILVTGGAGVIGSPLRTRRVLLRAESRVI